MRSAIPLAIVFALAFGATQAEAKSCSSFVVIKSYDAAKGTVQIDHERGSESKFFPRPEGSTTDTTKIPRKCSGKMKKQTSLGVKPSGGRLTVTQLRSNFEGRMLNDTDSDEWFAGQVEQLIAAETVVVAILRDGKMKDAPPFLSTVYLPITDAERAEIARIDAQAEDVE